jgi:hypothetical protein
MGINLIKGFFVSLLIFWKCFIPTVITTVVCSTNTFYHPIQVLKITEFKLNHFNLNQLLEKCHYHNVSPNWVRVLITFFTRFLVKKIGILCLVIYVIRLLLNISKLFSKFVWFKPSILSSFILSSIFKSLPQRVLSYNFGNTTSACLFQYLFSLWASCLQSRR